jgi:hypothetical protein
MTQHKESDDIDTHRSLKQTHSTIKHVFCIGKPAGDSGLLIFLSSSGNFNWFPALTFINMRICFQFISQQISNNSSSTQISLATPLYVGLPKRNLMSFHNLLTTWGSIFFLRIFPPRFSNFVGRRCIVPI